MFSSGDSTAAPVFERASLDGTQLEPGPSLPSEDQAFGTALGATFGFGGKPVVTTARPGVWLELENDAWTRRGTPLFPDDPPPLTEQTAPRQFRVTPAQHTASGLGVIGDSLVLQGVFSFDRPFDWSDPPGRDERRNELAVFRADGEYLAAIALPPSVTTTYPYVAPATGDVFLTASDPFPQVVEYRLSECPES